MSQTMIATAEAELIPFDTTDLTGQARAAFNEFRAYQARSQAAFAAYESAREDKDRALRVLTGLVQALDALITPDASPPFTLAELYEFDSDDPDTSQYRRIVNCALVAEGYNPLTPY